MVPESTFTWSVDSLAGTAESWVVMARGWSIRKRISSVGPGTVGIVPTGAGLFGRTTRGLLTLGIIPQ